MADAEKVINWFEVCRVNELCSTDCPYWDASTNAECAQKMASDALSVIRELQAENERLKQEKLINVDKLREKLGFAESCEKCKKDSWVCHHDAYFTEKDFCERLDIAIEELTKDGEAE